jgi:hypothetical protein
MARRWHKSNSIADARCRINYIACSWNARFTFLRMHPFGQRLIRWNYEMKLRSWVEKTTKLIVLTIVLNIVSCQLICPDRGTQPPVYDAASLCRIHYLTYKLDELKFYYQLFSVVFEITRNFEKRQLIIVLTIIVLNIVSQPI